MPKEIKNNITFFRCVKLKQDLNKVKLQEHLKIVQGERILLKTGKTCEAFESRKKQVL